MRVIVTCKNEEDPIKMKALECSQDFSDYKSMGIFPDAQGQLTPQSMVGSGRISNSSETSWLSSLPAKMKKIQSKMKALECSQNYTLIISDAQGQTTPESVVVSCRNLNSSELLNMSSLPARMKMIESTSSPKGNDRSPESQQVF